MTFCNPREHGVENCLINENDELQGDCVEHQVCEVDCGGQPHGTKDEENQTNDKLGHDEDQVQDGTDCWNQPNDSLSLAFARLYHFLGHVRHSEKIPENPFGLTEFIEA